MNRQNNDVNGGNRQNTDVQEVTAKKFSENKFSEIKS